MSIRLFRYITLYKRTKNNKGRAVRNIRDIFKNVFNGSCYFDAVYEFHFEPSSILNVDEMSLPNTYVEHFSPIPSFSVISC